MWKALKMFILNAKVPITSVEAVLEDVDVDDDGNISVRELIEYLYIWKVW